MPIDKTLLNSLKCCFSKDEHIALDPVLVIECQSSACKQCFLNFKEETKEKQRFAANINSMLVSFFLHKKI